MKIKKSQILIVALFFMLLQPFYVYILNTFHIYQLPLASVAVVLFLASLSNIKKNAVVMLTPWFFFFCYLAIRNVGDSKILILYFVNLFAMLCLANTMNWEQPFLKLFLFMTIPHAVATVSIFFVPSAYKMIRPFISAKNILYEGYKTGLTGHYSTNAIYISCGLIVLGSVLISGIQSSMQRKKTYCLLALFFFAILLTAKRGPLIFSIGALFITYLLIDFRRIASRTIKLIGIAILLIMAFYVAADFVPAISEFIQRFSSDGTSGREIMYALAISMFLRNPILGCGTGAYRVQYNMFLANDADHMYLNAHNVYLQLLCENGIVGLMLFLLAAVLTLKKGIQLLRLFHFQGDGLREKWMTASVSFQLFFLLYCLTGNPLYDSMMYTPYFIFCAFVYAVSIGVNNEKNRNNNFSQGL